MSRIKKSFIYFILSGDVMKKRCFKLFVLLQVIVCAITMISCNNNSSGLNKYSEESLLKKLDPLFRQKGFFTDDKTTLDLLDQCVADMQAYVINTKSNYKVNKGSTVYYFSENGADSNDGLTPQTAKKTLVELEYDVTLQPGDVVLFERGSTFRGTVKARTGVTYSAYGEGAKPIICASKQDYASSDLWEETEYENVYVCTKKINNAGNIMFNNTHTIGDYEQLLGNMKVSGVDDFKGPENLEQDLDFYCNNRLGKLYLYSSAGNPGERFESIEIAEGGDIISVSNVKDVLIDNLHLTLGGSHGVGATNSDNLTVRNCIFNWIGGSILTGTTRYGNAVESYKGSNAFYVYNNWIYQIYDTGITTQYSQDPQNKRNVMKDNEYFNNLIEYCFWSIEYYHKISDGVVRITENIYIHDNYCRMCGEGWGRTGAGHMCCLSPSGETIKNIKIENNVFDRGHAFLVSTYSADASQLTFNGNIYIQEKGSIIARICNKNYNMDDNALAVFTDTVGDKNAHVICVSNNQ